MYILPYFNHLTTMNRNFVYTFRTLTSVLNHLRCIAEVVSKMTIKHAPLSRFEELYPFVYSSLSDMKRGYVKTLCFNYFVNSFEYDYNPPSVDRVDLVVSYQVKYFNGRFEMRAYNLG